MSFNVNNLTLLILSMRYFPNGGLYLSLFLTLKYAIK